MIITTTNTIEGKKIESYHGVVTGEAIMGANVVRDIFANLTDFFGGRSGMYEKKLADARNVALKEMQDLAGAQGGNAVVGVSLDYEVIGKMLMVTCSGTSVKISG